MRIGIVDDQFYSLQGALLSEGNDLFVFIPDVPSISPENFPPTHHGEGSGNLTQVMSMAELVEHDLDFMIVGTALNPNAGDYLQTLAPHIPKMWYSRRIQQLEDDRTLAHAMIRQHATGINLPKLVEITSQDELSEYLSTVGHAVVIKQNAYSPQDVPVSRTVIVPDPEDYVVPELNSWFKDGVGGCTVEEFIEGPEICFAAWFDGTRFVGQPYYCMEHKGSFDHDRGGVLTGEVGTATGFFKPSVNSKAMAILRSMEPIFRGQMNGMIDFNTKMRIDEDGHVDLYFMEFTVRFGRPTLETQIAACIGGGHLVTDWLYLSVIGSDFMFTLRDNHLYSIGVTAYTYGLPILTNLVEQLDIDVSQMIPSQGTTYHEIEFDEQGYVFLPLFTKYCNESECYVATEEERHFIVCGVAHDIDTAREMAYTMLEDVELRGIVWRNDIGEEFPGVVERLKDNGYF